MYGTIAHFKVRPGMRSLLLNWVKYSSWTLRTIPGIVESTLIQLDESPHEFLLIVVFEDRESYAANAASPEQHVEYLQLLEFLAAKPEWNDGEIIWRSVTPDITR